MDKVTSIEQAVAQLHDGATILFGGFAGVGSPLRCIEAIVASGVKDLTVISEVSAMPGGHFDLGWLTDNHQVKKVITSHIGTDPTLVQQMRDGDVEVELYPQGTWAEKVRAGGAGLGGILTPTGVGTLVEKGKQKIEVNGREYLLELPLTADFAFIKGYRADRMGNVEYRRTAINSNPICAAAAKYTVAEVNEIVEVGELDPNRIGTPAIYVQAVVQGSTLDESKAELNEQWAKVGALKPRPEGE